MFKTFMGPVEESAAVVYLRPETAQGIYVNYLNVLQGSRQKIPFGIAQIGKAFRNEITPGNFIFRTREFEQMEMQFFVQAGQPTRSGSSSGASSGWPGTTTSASTPAKLRWHQHGPGELAHYAKAAYDIEYEFPFGWKEIEGIHNRTDFDLQRHQEASGKKLEYFDQATNERFLPYIVETSAGADRVTLTVLVDAYREEQVEGETRVVLGLPPAIAPIKVAVFPLVKKDGMPELATRLYHDLKPHVPAFYDDSGAIGRRYRRHGRGRHAVLHHGGRTDAAGRHRDGAAPGFDGAGAGGADRSGAGLDPRSPRLRIDMRTGDEHAPRKIGERVLRPESSMMSYGYDPPLSEGAVKCPIFQTSTFAFEIGGGGQGVLRGGLRTARAGVVARKLGLIYSRLNNPDLEILEDRLALWDDAESRRGLRQRHGGHHHLAARVPAPGDVLVHSEPLYGGSDHFIRHILPAWTSR